MPYAYDRATGDLAWRESDRDAQTDAVVTLARSRRYGAAPNAAGLLHRALGPVRAVVGSDPYGSDSAFEKASREVHRVLAALGLDRLGVEAVAGALDDDWKLVLRVG